MKVISFAKACTMFSLIRVRLQAQFRLNVSLNMCLLDYSFTDKNNKSTQDRVSFIFERGVLKAYECCVCVPVALFLLFG